MFLICKRKCLVNASFDQFSLFVLSLLRSTAKNSKHNAIPSTSSIVHTHQIDLLLVQNIEGLLKLFAHYFIFNVYFLILLISVLICTSFIVSCFSCHLHKLSYCYQSPCKRTSINLASTYLLSLCLSMLASIIQPS